MILSLGPGEPNYIPDALLGMAQDTVDFKILPFLQCYTRDLSDWQVIWFFSVHRDKWCSLAELANVLGYSHSDIAQKLAHMTEAKLLEERILVTGPIYHLTESPQLRQQVIHLGHEWEGIPGYTPG